MADEVECILHPAESHLGAVNGSLPILISKTATTAIYRDARGGKILLREGIGDANTKAMSPSVVPSQVPPSATRAGTVYLAWEA